MIQDSIFYILCCNTECKESGNIKKNFNKCPECKMTLTKLTLEILNKYFCPFNNKCPNMANCKLLHATKKHQSPPYISPCIDGIQCEVSNCVFLHPNLKCNSWIVRMDTK